AAQTQIDQARAVAPDDPEVLELLRLLDAVREKRVETALRAAQFYYTANNIVEAEKSYRDVLSVDPGNKAAQQALREIQQRKDTVEKYKESGISIAPSTGRSFDVEAYSAAAAWLRARAAFDRGDLDTSMKFVADILEKDPANDQALVLREKIRQIRHIGSLLASVDTEFGTGNYFSAVTALDGLLKEYPGRPDLLLKRGKALLRTNRPEDAILDFEPLLATETLRSQILPLLSDAYAAAGKFHQAAAIAAGPVDGSPVKPFHQRLLLISKAFPVSAAFLLLGCFAVLAAASWAWVQIDRLFERHAPGRFTALARLLLQAYTSDLDDRQTDSWKALSRQLHHPWLQYVTGLLLLRQGNLESAQEPLQKALESPALAPRAYYFLGNLRKKLGQPIAAHDLEQCLLAAFRRMDAPYLPSFLTGIESELVTRFVPADAKRRNDTESLAHQAAQEFLFNRPGS
ncbi:MAG TPA: tetratricopeptide repeat protein, partial [Candidatus Ozemobacteraceae bacterium]|nr:tetratricopeptide repeat protein [Candidatus Ozemobacteraceae bacterium]